MLSRTRSRFLPHVALLVVGVSACAGSSDINTPAGSGGNQSGSAGTTGGGGTGSGSAGTMGAGCGVIWPNDTSSTNSDDWLVQNHDRISQLRPKVLAIDIGNTSNATTLIQRHIDGLANATSFHKYSNTAAQPMVVYQL